MGQDIGFVVLEGTAADALVGGVAADVWPASGPVVADVSYAAWSHAERPLTTLHFRCATHARAVRLRLDEFAAEASRRLGTRTLAAFCADHYSLGGYRIWRAGVPEASELLEQEYTTGSRRGVEALLGRAVECDERAALFFTEDVADRLLEEGHTLLLAAGRAWLKRPRRVSPEAYRSIAISGYVVGYPPEHRVESMPVADLLANTTWIDVMTRVGAQLRAEGYEVSFGHAIDREPPAVAPAEDEEARPEPPLSLTGIDLEALRTDVLLEPLRLVALDALRRRHLAEHEDVPIPAAPKRRVQHRARPEWGAGDVVAELDGGRIEVLFERAGRKMLVDRAAYLIELPADE